MLNKCYVGVGIVTKKAVASKDVKVLEFLSVLQILHLIIF